MSEEGNFTGFGVSCLGLNFDLTVQIQFSFKMRMYRIVEAKISLEEHAV